MKSILTTATVILLLSFRPVASAADAAQADKSADEKALIQIEYEWANAYVSANADKLASILSPDYIQTNTRAQVTDKDEELSELRKGTFRYEKFETTQMKVQLFGDAAVVTGLITARGTDKASAKTIEGQMRITDTFIRQNGKWQVVASQTTRVPEAASEERKR